VVIGPAGSGKTTLLETVAGIIPQRTGALRLMGRDMAGVPPERRGIGFVYQRGYLFPHLSVEENVGYGSADPAFVRELSERLGVNALLDRDVRGLSGGEQQLVAIARALAARPRILLLDEPFSALDPRRRSLVRRTVRALHEELGMTVLQVTHDFTEAGLLGDIAILLDGGRVLQSGPPEQVFRRPASPYIAEFLGAENVFAGEVRVLPEPGGLAAQSTGSGSRREIANTSTADVSARDGGDVTSALDGTEIPGDGHHAIEFRTGPLTFYTVGDAHSGPGYAVIRAGEVLLSREPQHSSARNNFRGIVAEVATTGALAHVTVDVSGVPIVAALTTRSADELSLAPGAEVWVSFKAMAVHLC
jgi:molybdopterin-binding protein